MNKPIMKHAKPQRLATHKKLRRHVQKVVANRQESKAAKLERMLYPSFLPKVHTPGQEIVAGVVLGILLLMFLLSIVFIGVPSVRTFFVHPKQTAVQTQAPKPIIAQQDFLQLRLNSWRSTGGGPVFKAYPGFRYIVLNVDITHTYSTPTWLAPALQSYVMDESGQQYKLTPDDEITKPLPAKEYAPGKVASGELAYELPKAAQKLTWCYDLASDTAQSNPLCIELR